MAKKNPELVPCPWCDAPAGERCATEGPNGRIPMQIARAHASRYEALKQAGVPVAECHICSCWGCDRAHTGPYKLLRGGWSDGVDRRIELSDREPTLNRWEVFQDEFGDWVAYCERSGKEGSLREDFPPGAFAEAIAYADRAARTTKNGDNK